MNAVDSYESIFNYQNHVWVCLYLVGLGKYLVGTS